MLVISSAELRHNMKKYLDRAKEEPIVIQRGKTETFVLVRKEDETLMTKDDFFAKIDLSLKQYADGKFKTLEPNMDVHKFLTGLCTE